MTQVARAELRLAQREKGDSATGGARRFLASSRFVTRRRLEPDRSSKGPEENLASLPDWRRIDRRFAIFTPPAGGRLGCWVVVDDVVIPGVSQYGADCGPDIHRTE